MMQTNEKDEIWFEPGDAESVSCALADTLCWFAGFQSAGGNIGPVDIEPLREMNRRLKQLDWNRPSPPTSLKGENSDG